MKINDYVIISINDKRKRFKDKINIQLNSLNKHNVESVDANFDFNIINFFKNNINIKETRKNKRGFVGHFMSQINVLKYCIENNIENMLILEDDAILQDTFIKDLNFLLSNLPKDFDFFILFQDKQIPNCHLLSKIQSRNMPPVLPTQDQLLKNKIHDDWYVNNFITKAYQMIGTVGYVVSLKGCKKILNLIELNGFGTSRKNVTSYDEVLYFFSKFDVLNGYQINPNSDKVNLITIEDSINGTDTETTIRNTNDVDLESLMLNV